MPHPILAQYRAAHVARCEAAYDRSLRRNVFHGANLPNSLIVAGIWLVANGWDGPACSAEKALGWGPARYRLYLSPLTEQQRTDEIEAGRVAMFEGRHPVVAADVQQVAA